MILYLSYGYEVSEDESKDPLVNIAEEAMQGFSRASEPGAYLVDTIPWLKYLPDRIPGVKWKKDLKDMRRSRQALYDVPFDYVKKDMVRRNYTRQMGSHCVSRLDAGWGHCTSIICLILFRRKRRGYR